MGQRVQYRVCRDRVSMWSVWLMADVAWLVGYVAQTGLHWQARLRGDPQDKATKGLSSRQAAASHLLIAAGFCRRR